MDNYETDYRAVKKIKSISFLALKQVVNLQLCQPAQWASLVWSRERNWCHGDQHNNKNATASITTLRILNSSVMLSVVYAKHFV